MRVLVLNPGSATLKATVLEPPDREPRYERTLTWATAGGEAEDRSSRTVSVLIAESQGHGSAAAVDVVAYRVVHGGARFVRPIVIDDAVVDGIASLGDLAPLHNPIAAQVMRVGRRLVPDVPHVATFDTAFHSTLPEAAARYPVPDAWIADPAIRKFGFHGLSIEWSTRRATELLERSVEDLRLVVAHLGGGSSVTAVDSGRSVETSMGMTPLEGLMMGSRAGSIDPGVVLRRIEGGSPIGTVRTDLDERSGLAAVGGTSDMRELLERERAGDSRAALAIDMFVRKAAAGIAASATALPRVDAILFTGGIGRHASAVVERISERLHLLGRVRSEETIGDDVVTRHVSGPPTLRITAREDVVIADHALGAIGDNGWPGVGARRR